MVEYFVLVASQVGTLFLLMAVGYALARLGHFGYETQSQATTLLMYVVTPCLIVDTLQLSPSPELMRVMGLCLVLTLVLYLGFALLMGLLHLLQKFLLGNDGDKIPGLYLFSHFHLKIGHNTGNLAVHLLDTIVRKNNAGDPDAAGDCAQKAPGHCPHCGDEQAKSCQKSRWRRHGKTARCRSTVFPAGRTDENLLMIHGAHSSI